MMEVDEARQDRGTRTIDDLVRLAIHGTDRRDPAIFYEHVARDETALRSLRDDEPTTEEERHSRCLRWVRPQKGLSRMTGAGASAGRSHGAGRSARTRNVDVV